MTSLASPHVASPGADPAWPEQPLHHLDALWIQVAGTLCNLSCTHCFVSCGPGDLHHALMSRDEVGARVREGLALGVREFYFTGGEPFMHPQMLEILEDTLPFAPCTVLTNGTLFTHERLARIGRLAESARFSLEIRVSLDGATAADHDRFRGPGSFERALDGLRGLQRSGLLPIVTATHSTDEDELSFHGRYLELLRSAGLTRPRLKVLPMFRLGRETARSRGYQAFESLRSLPAEVFDPQRLQCGHCRAVTAKGVFVCPLLVDEPAGRLGDRLTDAQAPYPLTHGACFTCYVTGMTCANG